ncbi:MAG: hypothetical protein ACD_65C00265G0002, partial [uncultured bacterium]
MILLSLGIAKIPYGFNSRVEGEQDDGNSEIFTDDPEDFAWILTVGIFGNLHAARTYFTLRGPRWGVLDEKGKFPTSRMPNSEKINKDMEIYCDEKLITYHIVRGANNAVGHPERNPLNPADRAATFTAMKAWAARRRNDKRGYPFEVFEKGLSDV